MNFVAIVILLVIAFVLSQLPFIGPLVGLLITLLFWGMIGFFAGNIIRGRDFGLIGNVLLGVMGGIVGTIFVHIIGLGVITHIPIIGSFLVGLIGAVLFIFVIRLIDRNFAS